MFSFIDEKLLNMTRDYSYRLHSRLIWGSGLLFIQFLIIEGYCCLFIMSGTFRCNISKIKRQGKKRFKRLYFLKQVLRNVSYDHPLAHSGVSAYISYYILAVTVAHNYTKDLGSSFSCFRSIERYIKFLLIYLQGKFFRPFQVKKSHCWTN